MENTTIKLDRETKERLDKLKEYKRETYDEVLQKILEILNICRVSPERAKGKLIVIDRANRKNKVKPIKSQGMQSRP